MKKALLGVVVVSAVAVALWSRGGSTPAAEPAANDDKILLDRFWIDHIPRGERDIIQIFAAITEQPVGVFQATSQWKGGYEFFQYEEHGGELRIYYGQDGKREKVKARATKCNDKGMDYCLTLEGASRGVKKYYSMEDWVIDGARTPDELRHRIEMMLPKAAE